MPVRVGQRAAVERLADETNALVRREEARAQERAPLRGWDEGDQGIGSGSELLDAALQQRDTFGVPCRHEVGEEAARDTVLDRVTDDREPSQLPSAVRAEPPVVAWRIDVAPVEEALVTDELVRRGGRPPKLACVRAEPVHRPHIAASIGPRRPQPAAVRFPADCVANDGRRAQWTGPDPPPGQVAPAEVTYEDPV